MKDIYTLEMKKLAKGLVEKGIPFTFNKDTIMNGCQIIVYDDDGNRIWDAICHDGSYGHTSGLLEIMGTIVSDNINDTVEGSLTADEILKRL